MNSLRTIQAHLDVVGAGGFGFAFQDKIVALYDQDDYAFTI